MWGIVLGVIGVGLALYELATRDSATPLLPMGSPNARSTALRAARNPWDLDTPVLQQRAQACGLLPGDWRDASKWAAENISPNMGVLEALQLMYSTGAWQIWPNSAKRVYCTYIGNLSTNLTPQPPRYSWHS